MIKMLNKFSKILFTFCFATLMFISACKKDENSNSTPDEDINLGGETSISGSFINIFQQPSPNLSATELDFHRDADRAFGDIFVTAPSTINPGLGPVFNQNSCESCHISNGKSPFPSDFSDTKGLLMRLSIAGVDIHGGPLAIPNFGGQLQTKAVFGKQAEAKLSWQEVEEIKSYLDGEKFSLRKFNFKIENPYTNFPSDALISPRIGSQMIGLGLLEAIKESDIAALADPTDSNNDGISGKMNRVWDVQKQLITLGRFGWKAGQPNLLQQTAAAFNNDMGITNPLFKTESCANQSQADAFTDDPEIDETTLKAAAFYPQSLAVPRRRNWDNPAVQQGKKLFTSIKCAQCHNPKFVTGQHSDYTFLSNQTIFPYTDMLLHDMGDGLADNRPDFEANGKEWRTAPLWGIGLIKTVNGHSNFLHDGRARNLSEAILWHGGEAENSKESFRKLNKTDRDALISFLESL